MTVIKYYCGAQALTDRSHNAMTARATISDASQRVLTDRKMLHAVSRLPGLEKIPGACYKVFEAEQLLTMHAQHAHACACTQTLIRQLRFVGQCRREAGLTAIFARHSRILVVFYSNESLAYE